MNRSEMIAIIKASTNKEFLGEIEHFMGIEERDYDYDEVSALFDAMNLENQSNSVVRTCRNVLIEFGFFRVMPDEEIENTYVSNGRVPWNFKLKGVAYTTDETDEEWFDTEFRKEA